MRIYGYVDLHQAGFGLEAELGGFLAGAVVVGVAALAVGVLEEETADLGVGYKDVVGCDYGVVGVGDGGFRLMLVWIWVCGSYGRVILLAGELMGA